MPAIYWNEEMNMSCWCLETATEACMKNCKGKDADGNCILKTKYNELMEAENGKKISADNNR